MGVIQCASIGMSCAQVVDALGRIGKVEDARALVKPILPCAQPFRYRNKMAFTFAPQLQQVLPGLPRPAGFGLRNVSNPKEVRSCVILTSAYVPLQPGALIFCSVHRLQWAPIGFWVCCTMVINRWKQV